MKRCWGLVVALLIGGCSSTQLENRAPEAPRESALCGGQLQPLTGTEIANLIVGARLRFANDSGVCPGSIWITTNWELDFRAGGDVRLQYDRAPRYDRYVIAGDELCITRETDRHCHRLYRDENGRIYLAGAEVPGRLPAVVTIIR